MTDERGHAAVEWALLVPVVVMLACVLVAGGRLALARQQLHDAAGAAARAATLQPSASAGEAAARSLLAANVRDCRLVGTVVDASALRTPPGTPGRVRVRLTCRVATADLLVPGLPGGFTIDAEATAAVDTYARRGP